MSDSVLLELDGSAQSRYAAELLWTLAKANDWTVNAQHVVDSLAAWDFLNFDIAGFIGSGPYFEAHETMRSCLHRIGQNLIEAYVGNAVGHEIEGETYLDDGTTIREICWRAKDHNLVVIGQRGTGMSSPQEDKRRLPRRSIAETLTYYCPRPLLVVQDRTRSWTKANIVVSSTEMPAKLIAECVQFLEKAGIEPVLKAIVVNENLVEESVSDSQAGKSILAEVQKSVKQTAGKKTESVEVKDVFRYFERDSHSNPETLLVVPVAEVDGLRQTCFGATPDLILRYQTHPAVLLWIESPPADEFEEERASSAAARD